MELLLQRAKDFAFPGMPSSIDCCNWRYENCPTAHHGQFQCKEGVSTVTQKPFAMIAFTSDTSSLKWKNSFMILQSSVHPTSQRRWVRERTYFPSHTKLEMCGEISRTSSAMEFIPKYLSFSTVSPMQLEKTDPISPQDNKNAARQ